MEQKNDEFSMKEAIAFANSDAGKALFSTLNRNYGSEVARIRKMISDGDLSTAKEAIANLIRSSEEIRNQLPKDGD